MPPSGSFVRIVRPGTAEWIRSVGMHQSPGPTGYYWRPGMVDVSWTRRVLSVSGRTLTLDAPLTCALEPGDGAWLSTGSLPALHRIGIENLSCVSEYDVSNPSDEEHAWIAVEADGVCDSWVRDLRTSHFAFSSVLLGADTARITVADCVARAPVSELAGYRRHTFQASGQQHLFLRCTSEEGRHDFVAGYSCSGPIVFLECTAERSHGASGSVGSWATGLLFDNVRVDRGMLGFDNRETEDQGLGWNAANSVLWQCSASTILCRRPPGANNWAVGVWGQFLGDGVWSVVNGFAKPDSLYRAQLASRLGSSSLSALERAVYPAESPARFTPITSTASSPAPTALRLSVFNGWLVLGDELLIGGQKEVAWWRGQINPFRAPTVGLSLTRFAPGRSGPGLTDDLDQVADELLKARTPVLRHHYGLWYDRRRDDHEMTRRSDSRVWPPFYELPWARTGTGSTWNGLSKYDLTKYNPWYFGRLASFADIAARRGLVLFNEMYFQHNILEAGAHWVDFPWRPANAVQETGFPEPPEFVGGKRIFMADRFYDTGHPVRRPLHVAYIRQCLDNLRDHTNVIHSIGDEYTGPLEFARFWTDTVADWSRTSGHDPLIALSANKDVQDALLADPVRAAVYDIIEFKYWWLSPKGLYAPESGLNLAPRQSQREWKGGRPTAATLADMIWDYRSRFPQKAVECLFGEADGWATIAAGGSLPRLPETTDRELLRLLPRLLPQGPQGQGGDAPWLLCDGASLAFVYLPKGGSHTLQLPKGFAPSQLQTVDLATGKLSDPEPFSTSRLEASSGRPAAFLLRSLSL